MQLIEAILNVITAFITQLLNVISTFFIELLGGSGAPVAGEMNAFLAFFKKLAAIIPLLIIVYVIFKLLSSGMQILTKVVGVLLLIALAYLILNGFMDVDGLVNAGFTWS